MRILLVEDDKLVAQVLEKALSSQHYVVDVAYNGQDGWELADAFSYDLILLDVMLPQINGLTLCRRLRSRGLRTPILMLTAQDDSTDQVLGLDAGADDYVTKPFDLQALMARIRALLRRGSSTLPPLLEWGEVCLNPSSCTVTYGNQPIHLRPKEYDLLELFLRNRQRVFSRGAILNHLWSFEEPPGEETVTAHIKGLRQNLKAAGVPDDPIETVYGIGYRLRALQPQQSKSQKKDGKKSEFASKEIEQKIVAGVSGVWERLKEKLDNRVAVIEQATTAMLQDTLNSELRQKAEKEAHKLAGSLGMFDFDQGSRLAQEMEHLFQLQESLNQKQRLRLSELVIALRQELQRATVTQQYQLKSVDERSLLLIMTQEQSLAQKLRRKAAAGNMRTMIATNLTTAREHISRERPDVVLLDLSSRKKESENALSLEAGLTLLAELSACTPPVPVLVLTDQKSLLDRVKVARLGGRGFLQKSLPPAEVLEAVNQVLQKFHTTTSRVMLVDDDPLISTTLHRLLEPWGIKLYTLDSPLQFWNTLEATSPDLLILDVEMPEMSGMDLCQVVRNDPHWSDLPVLFLTAHQDLETMHRVFAVGGDDYVSKPIVGPELVTRILNRLERSRLLRNLRQTDTLTGVANRRQSSKELSQLMHLASRHNQPLCFAVLEIDHLKQINSQYGHGVGDEVLSRLGKLLRRTFQSEDVVGRWGGTEFIIGMYGMKCSEGMQRLSEVQEILNKEVLVTSEGGKLRVSFSAGVVQYPEQGTELQVLYRAAEAALHRAKTVAEEGILAEGSMPPSQQL